MVFTPASKWSNSEWTSVEKYIENFNSENVYERIIIIATSVFWKLEVALHIEKWMVSDTKTINPNKYLNQVINLPNVGINISKFYWKNDCLFSILSAVLLEWLQKSSENWMKPFNPYSTFEGYL